ncbi:MAG: restriction endonuclease [Anaerolineae bacterium]|nr:restriction endonuclease [Anaerolineae bacterium]
MKITKKYSHLNGEEWLLVHEKEVYQEILDIIRSVDAEKCRTKISKERRFTGKPLFSPIALNREFDKHFSKCGWQSTRYSYYVAHDFEQLETMRNMSLEGQRTYLLAQNAEPIFSYNQTDHVKNQIAIEVQFGKYAFVAYDLFVKHLAFYTGRLINVGIEILPTKSMQREMSSGVAYYEGELHNILRHGRSSPPVPLVILGLDID